MIRPLDLSDLLVTEELYHLQQAAYRVEAEKIGFDELPPLLETFEELSSCDETFLGWFAEDRLIGAVSYTANNQTVTICRLVVDPEYFRQGVGMKLLAAAEQKNAGAALFQVSTGRDNDPAVTLYLSSGYHWERDLEVAPGITISFFRKNVL